MQHYLEQLIGDIRKATLNIRPPHDIWERSEADPDNEAELEDISYIEQYFEGVEEPIASITGIDAFSLPPTEKLTDEQKALLSTELEKLLEIFNFILDFPKDYPMHLRYPFIRRFWDEEHVPLSFGESHIEFCNYERNECPFPGYCPTCDEVEKQMEFDNAIPGSDTTVDWDLKDLLPTKEEVEEWMRKNHPDPD